MDNVIYSASPFEAFLGTFATMGVVLLIGLGGMASVIFQRRQKPLSRIGMGVLSGFLIMVAIATGLLTWRTYRSGSLTAAARLYDKFVAHDNCGDGRVCERYVLEMDAGQKFYDLNVSQDAFEKAQVRVCYQFTYYREKGLLGLSENIDSYEMVGNITWLEAVPDSQCNRAN